MGDIDTDSDSIGEPEYGPVVDINGPAEADWQNCVNREPEPELDDVEDVQHLPIVLGEEDEEVVQNVPNVPNVQNVQGGQIAQEAEQQDHNEDLWQLNADALPNVTFQILLTLIRRQLVLVSLIIKQTFC